jgi:dTDP-4-amino-4,6-dideoxygalactose transaminase
MKRHFLHELEHDAREAAAAAAAIDTQQWTGHGRIGRRVEEQLALMFAPGEVLLATSCTHAIEMALALAEVGPGDDVIVPSYAFVSCANAVVQLGAKPVFADIELDTLGIDPSSVDAVRTPRTKAILGIDYAGLPLRYGELLPLIEKHEWFFIEDAAHGFGARYQGKLLGTFGDAGCFSFHATKNISCGEGGGLWLSDARLIGLAEQMREKGTDRTRFLNGLVDKYTWRTRGSSYVLSDILAAVLEVQLQKADAINARRREHFEAYCRELGSKSGALSITAPKIAKDAEPNGHLMWVLLHGGAKRRDEVMARLRQAGTDASFHYLPLHESPYAKENGFYRGPLANSERAAAELVRLPLHSRMSDADRKEIIERFATIASQVG